jgi:hypothetical protein
MKHDPIVEEVRRVRDGLARRFNYDLRAIGQDLLRRQCATLSEKELDAIREKPSPANALLAVRERPENDYHAK